MIGHGTILGGVVTTPDIDAALVDYAGTLALDLVSDAPLGEAVAASWGVPDLAPARCATLRPASGEPCWMRLVEQPLEPAFAPVRSFGWAAYELTVKDVFGWPERLSGSGFTIVGNPREIPGLPYFVAMQVTGRGREMLYLNEVRCDTPTSDLPPAKSDADRIFITILATPDFDATLAWYRDALRLDEGGRYEIVYSMINQSFGLPVGWRWSRRGECRSSRSTPIPPPQRTAPWHAASFPRAMPSSASRSTISMRCPSTG